MRALVAVAALALLTTGGSVQAKKDRNAVPPATPSGKAVSCVTLNQIRETRVHGDKVIDFHMTGGRVYRNELPYSCSSLGFEERFSYKTSLNQLCSTDIITVLRTPPSIPGPSCGLGQFQPVDIARK
ncbi:hypothetical protein [Sphingomonas cavernae]|uniref:Secreted protein n=1 Tax=Sphingomonas cavernae TaxID=2320861 RepID=A0A418W6J1_9SPHN|nr:hypothetical protein [Sphingomonas cavernae]RJF85650.1 hypothetical protein D3876_17255 [Sphingomonas cavernae]